mmetsp:Transcript_93831/g.201472  ORF Transcript_93831/g.201472 Transcript_93831/m.201472 type:complete len:215 (-) Transcript_93831:212-856(-)
MSSHCLLKVFLFHITLRLGIIAHLLQLPWCHGIRANLLCWGVFRALVFQHRYRYGHGHGEAAFAIQPPHDLVVFVHLFITFKKLRGHTICCRVHEHLQDPRILGGLHKCARAHSEVGGHTIVIVVVPVRSRRAKTVWQVRLFTPIPSIREAEVIKSVAVDYVDETFLRLAVLEKYRSLHTTARLRSQERLALGHLALGLELLEIGDVLLPILGI